MNKNQISSSSEEVTNESETESETAEDASSLEWTLCGEYEEVFLGGMEICLINSYILFLKTLVEELRGPYRLHREQASTSVSTDEPRLNGKLHIVLKGAKRDCKVCSNRNKPGGK
ncbi:LOW QUALITY PROTEIN: piggyBac transposable element-derived protein 4-like [Vespula squamosa]|uniref:PiggyBac transposable element-derived protein 4-like n=1 Tax=Vespula squamosa TaxID=30214 RepID=A0ABD2AF67_VESSQ